MMFSRGYNQVYHCFDRYGSFFGSGWMIWSILALLAAVLVIIVITSKMKQNQLVNTYDDRVLEELKLRYARGEITEDEYLKRARVISRK